MVGDNQCRHLNPYTKLLHKPYRLFYRLKPRAANVLIKILIPLEVYIVHIQIRCNNPCCLGACVSITHKNILYALLMCKSCTVIGKLKEYGWVGIGILQTL